MNEISQFSNRTAITVSLKEPASSRAAAALIAIAFALLAGGCATSDPKEPTSKVQRPTSAGVSQDELDEALANYEQAFVGSIKRLSTELTELMPDRDGYRKVLEFRESAIESGRAMLEQEDRLDALIDSWVLAIRLSQYLKSGTGKDLFGEHQSLAVREVDRLLAHVEMVAARVLTRGTFVEVRKTSYQFAGKHPIRANYANIIVFATEGVGDEPSPFPSIADITLAPFRAIGGGTQTALGTNRLSDATVRFSDVVKEMPESARWQLLLLLYDLEEFDTVESAKNSFRELAAASTKFADSTATMPQEMRKQMSIMLDDIDAKQKNLQSTIVKARDAALAFDETARSVTTAAEHWEDAVRATGDTLAMIKSDKKPDPEKPTPDQLERVQATAHATAQAADEVEAAAREIRQLVESAKAGDVVGETFVHASTLVDRMSIRLAQLLGLSLVLAVVYKLIVRWVAAAEQT